MLTDEERELLKNMDVSLFDSLSEKNKEYYMSLVNKSKQERQQKLMVDSVSSDLATSGGAPALIYGQGLTSLSHVPNWDKSSVEEKLYDAEHLRQQLLSRLKTQYKGDFNKLLNNINQGKPLPAGVSPNTRDFYNMVKDVYELPTQNDGDLNNFDMSLKNIQSNDSNAFNPMVTQTINQMWRADSPSTLDYVFPSARYRGKMDQGIGSQMVGGALDVLSLPSRGIGALATGDMETMAIPTEMAGPAQQFLDYTAGGIGSGLASKGLGAGVNALVRNPATKKALSNVGKFDELYSPDFKRMKEASNIIKNPSYKPAPTNLFKETAKDVAQFDAIPTLHMASTDERVNPNAKRDALVGLAGSGILTGIGKGIGRGIDEFVQKSGTELERYGRGPLDRLIPYEKDFPSYDEMMTPQETIGMLKKSTDDYVPSIQNSQNIGIHNLTEYDRDIWKKSALKTKDKLDELLNEGALTPDEEAVISKISKNLPRVQTYEQFHAIQRMIGERTNTGNPIYNKAYAKFKEGFKEVGDDIKPEHKVSSGLLDYEEASNLLRDIKGYTDNIPGVKDGDLDPYKLDRDLAGIGRRRLDPQQQAGRYQDVQQEKATGNFTYKPKWREEGEPPIDLIDLNRMSRDISMTSINQPKVPKNPTYVDLYDYYFRSAGGDNRYMGDIYMSDETKAYRNILEKRRDELEEGLESFGPNPDAIDRETLAELNNNISSELEALQKFDKGMRKDSNDFLNRMDTTINIINETESPYLTMAVMDQIRKRLKGSGDDKAVTTFDRLIDIAIQQGVMKKGTGIAKQALISLIKNATQVGAPMASTRLFDDKRRKSLRETFAEKPELPELDWGL